jgi:hypothetical protein
VLVKTYNRLWIARRQSKRAARKWFREVVESDRKEPSLTLDDVKKLADKPLQHGLMPMILAEAPSLFLMTLNVLCTDDAVGFITSDRPAFYFDARTEAQRFPHNIPRLASRTVEVTMPRSPYQMALLTWAKQSTYQGVGSSTVDALNRRQRRRCSGAFVVRSNETRSWWFDDQPDIPAFKCQDCEQTSKF